MFKRLFLSLILIAIPASADVLQVAISGTFDNFAASSALTAPNAYWALTFDIDSQPAPSDSTNSYFETTAASNLEYDLNHKAVSMPIFAGPIVFQDAAGEGLLALNIDAGDTSLSLLLNTLDPLYSGKTSSPEILTGTFGILDGNGSVNVLDNSGGADPESGSIVITDVPTPEPRSDLLLGTGLAGSAFLLRRRRRFAASRKGAQA